METSMSSQSAMPTTPSTFMFKDFAVVEVVFLLRHWAKLMEQVAAR